MSDKIKKIEEEIIYLKNEKAVLQDPFLSIGRINTDTPESIESKIEAKERQRQFELEREDRENSRKIYNQPWVHVLATAVFTVVATLLAS